MEGKNKLMAFEMRCYRRILIVRWQQKITKEEIRKEWAARETSYRELRKGNYT